MGSQVTRVQSGYIQTHSPNPFSMSHPNTINAASIEAGQAVYTTSTLRIYDLLVMGFSNPILWKCPTPALIAHYTRHRGPRHLEVGAGTGFIPDKANVSGEHLALLDLNPQTLAYASQRLARFQPSTLQANLFEPIAYTGPAFDSINLGYVLHCLPGSMDEKSVVLDHLRPLLHPKGVLFGSTLLGAGVAHNWGARHLMATYNRKGIFCNTADSLESLRKNLQQRFREVHIQLHGCGALFSARN